MFCCKTCNFVIKNEWYINKVWNFSVVQTPNLRTSSLTSEIFIIASAHRIFSFTLPFLTKPKSPNSHFPNLISQFESFFEETTKTHQTFYPNSETDATKHRNPSESHPSEANLHSPEAHNIGPSR